MSFPVTRPSESLNTKSVVHEHICLFTHDLKRKTKRWQDGRLKFHLFNKRIVVVDDRGGNVGDAHFTAAMSGTGSDMVEEGDEFSLDRGGAIVQVCERTGSREVDLEAVVDRRAREVEKRRREAAAKAPTASTQSNGSARPLNSIVTPARTGRAVVAKESPFEQRMRREREREGGHDTPPPAKRQRREPSPPSKSTHARALFGTTLTLTTPSSSWQRPQALRDRTNVRSQPSQPSSSPGRDQENHPDEFPKHKLARRESRQSESRGRMAEPTQSSPEPDDERRLVQEEAPTRATMKATSSRLGGLRIERKSETDAYNPSKGPEGSNHSSKRVPLTSSPPDSSKFDDANATQPVPCASRKSVDPARAQEAEERAQKAAASKGFTRPDPREDHAMNDDDDDGDSAVGSRRPQQKKREKPKPTSRPSRPKSDTTTRKELLQPKEAVVAQESLDVGLSDPKSDPKSDRPKEERRTALRIGKRKKRGLLMLAQPEPRAEETSPPEPEPPTKKPPPTPPPPPKADVAGFEAWLNDEDDMQVELDVGPHDEQSLISGEIGANKGAQCLDLGQMENPSPPFKGAGSVIGQSRHESSLEGKPNVKADGEVKREKAYASAAASPPTEPVEAREPPASPDDRQSSPKLRRRAKKQASKPVVEPPVSSPSSPPAEPEPVQTAVHSSESDDDWAGPPPGTAPAARTTRRRQTRAPSYAEDEDLPLDGEIAPPKAAAKKKESGIKISRISRSCRSKVITGYVEKNESSAPYGLGSAAERIGWGSTAAALAAGTPGKKTEQVEDPAEEDNSPDERVASKESAQTQPLDSGRAQLVEYQTAPQDEDTESTSQTKASNDKTTGAQEKPSSPEATVQSIATPGEASRIPAEEPEQAPRTTDKTKPARRQISNPATRGRKAASKADAAGSLLLTQQMVPFDEPRPQSVRPLARGRPLSAAVAAPKERAMNAEPQRDAAEGQEGKKALPGFAKANGGAWSRHANDLLGMGRPERQRR